MKKLVIISHTEHQLDLNGNYVGWGPTVNEINYLSQFWKEVTHVACLEKGQKVRGSSIGYIHSNVKFEPIPTFGGKNIWQKLDIIWKMPKILWKVQKSIKEATHVQLRVPMGIGIFLIPYFALRNKSNYIFWVKYANNWGDSKPKLGFRIQRWMLINNLAKCKVTINGFWPNQPKHCISFENPCLSKKDLENGEQSIQSKSFEKPLQVVFIGRIDIDKGVDILIEFLKGVNYLDIECVHIIGIGPLLFELEKTLKIIGFTYKIHGNLIQNELFEILKQTHVVILPSRSEGFPKVLAEAMNFGCVPIATNVGSIAHYIKNKETGFIMDSISFESLIEEWNAFIRTSIDQKLKIVKCGFEIASSFTFEKYLENLKLKIFNGN